MPELNCKYNIGTICMLTPIYFVYVLLLFYWVYTKDYIILIKCEISYFIAIIQDHRENSHDLYVQKTTHLPFGDA